MLNLRNRNATSCADENGPGETTLDQVRSRIAAPAGVRFEDTRGTPGSLAAPRVAFDNDLGAACFEVTRLARQATFVRDLTEDVLRRAGVERGMRVLDLGCGNGDTSLLLAKLVGPSGLVVGVDPSLEAIDVAEKRATAAGRCYWTRFIAADLDTFGRCPAHTLAVARKSRCLAAAFPPGSSPPGSSRRNRRAPADAGRAASSICPIPPPHSPSIYLGAHHSDGWQSQRRSRAST
jgi:SAM-dependent methyltransferase